MANTKTSKSASTKKATTKKTKDVEEKVNVIECTADTECEITGISYNSKLTKAGDAFVAIKGLSTDGHKFIPMAAENGASADSVRSGDR